MRHDTTRSGSDSETELPVIKQEEYFNKDLLLGDDNASRPECAQVIDGCKLYFLLAT